MSYPRRYSICCAVVLTLMFSVSAVAKDTGHIFTTNTAGQTVDQNIYPSKSDVWLTGGPNNCNSGAGLTEGYYEFQVTTPDGTVLSTDPASDRGRFHVNTAGFTDSYVGTHAEIVVNVCSTSGNTDPNNLQPGQAIGIQLIPYNDTTNPGGEYKAWACQVADAAGNPVSTNNGSFCVEATAGDSSAFVDSLSKTDNFKVRTETCTSNCGPVTWPIAGVKFFDPNGTGVLSAAGTGNSYTPTSGIAGWKFKLVSACNGLSTPTLPGGGCLVLPDAKAAGATATTDDLGRFRFDGLTAGDSYGVCEIFPTPLNASFSWQATAACPNSYPGFTLSSPDVLGQSTFGGAYSIGNSEYGVPYPTTFDGPTQHLGLGDAICNNPSNPNPNAFVTNVSDVFEWGTPGANFGNRCINTPTGGLTLGFWSNNNGVAAITAAGGGTVTGGLAYVNGLKVPNGGALLFVQSTGLMTPLPWFTSLQCGTKNATTHCWSFWLTSGSSANAANQLSIQMAAARLNELLNGQSFGDIVYAPGTNCADSFGYAQVGCLINEGNQAIGSNLPASANTTSTSTASCTGAPTGSTCRVWEVAIQAALNRANNNTGVNPSTLAGALAECGLNYTDSNSCSVTVPLAPPSPFSLPLTQR